MTIRLNVSLQVLTAFLLLYSSQVLGQQTVQGTATFKANVLKEITEASKIARVDLSDTFLKDFLTLSEVQSIDVDEVYKGVPKDIRVIRLAEYLNAKSDVVKSSEAQKMGSSSISL